MLSSPLLPHYILSHPVSVSFMIVWIQLDPANTGKIGAVEAAQFLKKSGLSDSTLSKIWDLSDSERKGFLDKRGFFIALRLVASAQSGNDVSQSSLNQTISIPTPKFRDTASPSLVSTASSDATWAVKFDDKVKYDGIFESLLPVGGLLSGDKVKPVLINSNLPLDVLGKIWNLSDVDKDGHLDKEEFSVAMHLVYRAREKEPVPSTLPSSLIPPSKLKKTGVALPGSVPVLPSSPFLMKDALRSTVPLSKSPLTPVSLNWVVPQEDREQYEEIFELADSDFDGMVGGGEVKDIFINSGLPQGVLAHIWSLADTKCTGKLTKEQFCLAMHLIQQKVKGVDPPQNLTPEMIPPSERGSTSSTDSSSTLAPVELTGIKELDDISQEISRLQSEKRSIEQEIRQKEEVIRQKNNEVHGMQGELEHENSSLQDLEQQKQVAQDRLQEMEQQRSKLDGMEKDAKSKCTEETSRISSLQTQILSQESDLKTQEKELSRTKTDLYCLEQEENQLEESLRAGKAKLESILKLLKTSQDEMDETRSEISQIQESQKALNKSIERFTKALNGNMSNLSEIDQLLTEESSIPSTTVVSDSFKSKLAMFNTNPTQDLSKDPFQSEDPFRSDPFNKGAFINYYFSLSLSVDPFATADPFGYDSFGGKTGFADFGNMSKVGGRSLLKRSIHSSDHRKAQVHFEPPVVTYLSVAAITACLMPFDFESECVNINIQETFTEVLK
uniref:Epidermal growth factor receptor pathway substrate 15 like 1 n=1 Tax=Pygocentrus nattereri TaxID=42514 RepID=A0AAR2LAQ1_PYGNA